MKNKSKSSKKTVDHFFEKNVKEHPITEGRTYLARIKQDPWKGYPSHESIVGQIVKVTSYPVVNVEWANGAKNSFSRDYVEIIGECK